MSFGTGQQSSPIQGKPHSSLDVKLSSPFDSLEEQDMVPAFSSRFGNVFSASDLLAEDVSDAVKGTPSSVKSDKSNDGSKTLLSVHDAAPGSQKPHVSVASAKTDMHTHTVSSTPDQAAPILSQNRFGSIILDASSLAPSARSPSPHADDRDTHTASMLRSSKFGSVLLDPGSLGGETKSLVTTHRRNSDDYNDDDSGSLSPPSDSDSDKEYSKPKTLGYAGGHPPQNASQSRSSAAPAERVVSTSKFGNVLDASELLQATEGAVSSSKFGNVLDASELLVGMHANKPASSKFGNVLDASQLLKSRDDDSSPDRQTDRPLSKFGNLLDASELVTSQQDYGVSLSGSESVHLSPATTDSSSSSSSRALSESNMLKPQPSTLPSRVASKFGNVLDASELLQASEGAVSSSKFGNVLDASELLNDNSDTKTSTIQEQRPAQSSTAVPKSNHTVASGKSNAHVPNNKMLASKFGNVLLASELSAEPVIFTKKSGDGERQDVCSEYGSFEEYEESLCSDGAEEEPRIGHAMYADNQASSVRVTPKSAAIPTPRAPAEDEKDTGMNLRDLFAGFSAAIPRPEVRDVCIGGDAPVPPDPDEVRWTRPPFGLPYLAVVLLVANTHTH
jgi:hypothetical protein